jgi:hypothetical protein
MRRYPAIEPPNGEASDGSVAGAGNGGAPGEPVAAAFAALAAVDVASLAADEALVAAEQARVLAGFALGRGGSGERPTGGRR